MMSRHNWLRSLQKVLSSVNILNDEWSKKHATLILGYVSMLNRLKKKLQYVHNAYTWFVFQTEITHTPNKQLYMGVLLFKDNRYITGRGEGGFKRWMYFLIPNRRKHRSKCTFLFHEVAVYKLEAMTTYHNFLW